MTTVSIKEALHELAEQLPESATWKDVAYEAYVRQELEAGLAEVQRGELAGESKVNESFTRWGVQIAEKTGQTRPRATEHNSAS